MTDDDVNPENLCSEVIIPLSKNNDWYYISDNLE